MNLEEIKVFEVNMNDFEFEKTSVDSREELEELRESIKK